MKDEEFIKGIYKDSEEELKEVYKEQKKNRDKILSYIAEIMLSYKIVDSIMELSNKEYSKEYKKITKVIVIQEEVNSEGVDTNPNHCTTNSASNLNNHNNVVIVSGQVPKEIIGIKFPCCAAYIILFLNLILPGVGTMVGSCFITDPVLRASFCCSGCYELFMAFLFVGWCFALCHSCMFIGAAHSGMTFEEYHRTMNKSRY